MNDFKIVEAVISGTPIWVWIILLYLIKRGFDMKKESVVNVKKAFIFPVIFIMWGLETVFTKFSYPLDAIIAYIVALVIGSYIGAVVYSTKQTFYMDGHRLIRNGSSLPLVIILTNFSVKYALNVYMNISHTATTSLYFTLVYSILAGFTVGLFLGGIINTMRNKKVLEG